MFVGLCNDNFWLLSISPHCSLALGQICTKKKGMTVWIWANLLHTSPVERHCLHVNEKEMIHRSKVWNTTRTIVANFLLGRLCFLKIMWCDSGPFAASTACTHIDTEIVQFKGDFSKFRSMVLRDAGRRTLHDWGQIWPSLALNWAKHKPIWAQLRHNLGRTQASWLQFGPKLVKQGVEPGTQKERNNQSAKPCKQNIQAHSSFVHLSHNVDSVLYPNLSSC